MQKARILFPGGDEQDRYPLDLKKFTLKELQVMVGGYIERVKLPRGNRHDIMYVDEDGLSKQQAHNMRASLIAHCRIVGTAVIVSTVHANSPSHSVT